MKATFVKALIVPAVFAIFAAPAMAVSVPAPDTVAEQVSLLSSHQSSAENHFNGMLLLARNGGSGCDGSGSGGGGNGGGGNGGGGNGGGGRRQACAGAQGQQGSTAATGKGSRLADSSASIARFLLTPQR